MFCTNIGPSGFPKDVAVDRISSVGAELSWNPPLPEERNGIITSYLIIVTRQATGYQSQYTSTTTNFNLNMLDPFTAYTVTVAASTIIGSGPQSTQLSFTTVVDGNDICLFESLCYILCIILNSSSQCSCKSHWSSN